MLRHLFAVLLLLPIAGCIVFVPSYDAVDNCPINGDSICGTCLRAKCQADINTCCGTEACVEASSYTLDESEFYTTIAALDVCAGGDKAGCEDKLKSANDSTAKETVNRCVSDNCRSECLSGGSALTKWTCASPPGPGACATCIQTECATQVESCCTETSGYGTCSGLLQTEMTACIAGDKPGCAAMRNGSGSGKAGVVRACVSRSCSDECFGNGTKHQSCTLQNGGDYCECTDATTASGDECSTTALPKSHCFFRPGGCICGYYACEIKYSSSDPACTCKMSYSKDGTGEAAKCSPSTLSGSETTLKDTVCCAKLGTNGYSEMSCTCDTSGTCASDEYTVYSCDKSQFFSALADLATDTCSQ